MNVKKLKLELQTKQKETLSAYFSDISKILVGSAVIGFFFPIEGKVVSITGFLTGFVIAIGCLIISLYINQHDR